MVIKRECSAMDQSTGKCRVCKGKCDWNMHENRDFIWQEYEEEVTKTDEYLKQKYVQKSSEKSAKEQILEGLEQEISRQNVESQSPIPNPHLKPILFFK